MVSFTDWLEAMVSLRAPVELVEMIGHRAGIEAKRMCLGNPEGGAVIASVTHAAVLRAFGCCCRLPGNPGQPYWPDVDCPMHGSGDPPPGGKAQGHAA